jgi:hypothetical protein
MLQWSHKWLQIYRNELYQKKKKKKKNLYSYLISGKNNTIHI